MLRKIIFTLILVHSIALIAQNKNGNGEDVAGTRPPSDIPLSGKPWETRKTFGVNQVPAFKGQTRIGSAHTKTPYNAEVITNELEHPWGMAFMPDGRMLVTGRYGTLKIVTQNGLVSDTVKGMPKDILTKGDAGLLDIAVDPSFNENRKFYFAYVQKLENGRSRVNIASASLGNDEFHIEDFKIIYKVNDSTGGGAGHFGSRLLFDRKGKLLVSFGERLFKDVRKNAQSLSSALGKIIRINTDGVAAEDNPLLFPKNPDALPEVIAYGFRNPQGLALNPLTGDLWEAEHGTQGGDEINIVRPGNNYGWPVIAYGMEYDWTPIESGITHKPGMEQPVYYWDPTIAPSGCVFYSGSAIPEWKNNLFVASLAGQHLVRLVVQDDRIVGEERLLLDQHHRIRDVEMGPDGNLWVLTDADKGRLIRIAPR